MVTQEKLNELLAELKADVARMKPTPLSMAMATDVFWAADPLPVPSSDLDGLCPHGESGGTCRRCYYESSNAFDAAMDAMHEDKGHD